MKELSVCRLTLWGHIFLHFSGSLITILSSKLRNSKWRIQYGYCDRYFEKMSRHIGSAILNFEIMMPDSWLGTLKPFVYQISGRFNKNCIQTNPFSHTKCSFSIFKKILTKNQKFWKKSMLWYKAQNKCKKIGKALGFSV